MYKIINKLVKKLKLNNFSNFFNTYSYSAKENNNIHISELVISENKVTIYILIRKIK